MSARMITLPEARVQYPHRFTCEHVPAWALRGHRHKDGPYAGRVMYYAPQFRTDSEWYANTRFPGEKGHPGTETGRKSSDCHTSGQTWPLGQWLSAPYRFVRSEATT